MVIDELHVRGIHELEHVLRTMKHGEEGRRLRKDVAKPTLGALRVQARLAQRMLGPYAPGRLRGDVEVGDDLAVLTAHGTQRVGKPGVVSGTIRPRHDAVSYTHLRAHETG